MLSVWLIAVSEMVVFDVSQTFNAERVEERGGKVIGRKAKSV